NDALISLGEQSLASRYFMAGRIKSEHFNDVPGPIGPLDSVRWDGSQPIRAYGEYHQKGYFDYDPAKNKMTKILQLKLLERLCKQKGIRLILVYPPNFRDPTPKFVDKVKSVTGPATLHYHYDDEDPRYKDKWMYYDQDHLHLHGAIYFTNELIGHLKTLNL
ncbi:MAG: hypothetical protein AAF570_16510, partial [Bacteroidota bacterium]